jgi:hypothetical protein
LPVHPATAIIRQPTFALVNPSSLQSRGVDHSLRKKEILKLQQTKLRGPLESIKACEKEAKTKLSEAEKAEKLIIGKEWAGRTYRDSFQRVRPYRITGFRQNAYLCFPSFPRLWPKSAVRPSSPPVRPAAAACSLYEWAYHLPKLPENMQITSTPESWNVSWNQQHKLKRGARS